MTRSSGLLIFFLAAYASALASPAAGCRLMRSAISSFDVFPRKRLCRPAGFAGNSPSIRSLSVFALLICVATASAADEARVIDGNTLQIGNEKIRLWGIDAPERYQRCERNGRKYLCGLEAESELRRLIRGKRVACESVTKCAIRKRLINQEVPMNSPSNRYNSQKEQVKRVT